MQFSSLCDRLDELSWHLVSRLAATKVLASSFLGLIAIISYLPGQLNLPAIDRTEGMVALSSKHIVESGEYLKPRWGTNIQRTRPVGIFWAQGLSAAAQGAEARNHIATYRLPSLISTVLAVLLMFWLASRLIGPVPALMASAAVAVTPIVALHAQLAIAEPLMLPSVVVAQLSLLAIYQERAASWFGWLGAFWVALGISTWFNALAAPLLALTTVTALSVLDRRWRLVRRLEPWFGLPLLGLLALPWLAAVWVIDGGTLYRDLGVWAVLDALEGGQSMKFKTVYGVFILTLVLGFLPVAHMLGPVVGRYWRSRHDPLLRFLLVWLIVPIIALEALSNKPPLYTVQTVLPAGALLTSLAVARLAPYHVEVRALPGMFWGTAVLLLIVAPALFGGVLWVTDTPLSWQLIAGFLIMVGLFLIAGWVSAYGYGMAWFASGVLGTFIFGIWFNGLMMPGLRNFWTAPQINRAVKALDPCGPVYISGFREPSLALAVAGRAKLGTPNTAARGFARDKSAVAIIESRQSEAFKKSLGDRVSMKSLGCIRSLNLARGCSLMFNVYQRNESGQNGDCQWRAAPGSCQSNSGGEALMSHTLKIPHCR